MKVDPTTQLLANIPVSRTEAMNAEYGKAKPVATKDQSPSKSADTIQNSGEPVSVSLSLSRQTVDTLERLGNLNNFLSNVATNLKKTEDGLKTANAAVEQMKAELGKIVKNFPPFNLESEARMQLLMSYSAIQKEMSKMTVPPPPQPLYDRVQHLWQDLFAGENGQILSTPVLPKDAPDAHVNSALQRLEGTQSQIAIVSSELGNSLLSKQESP